MGRLRCNLMASDCVYQIAMFENATLRPVLHHSTLAVTRAMESFSKQTDAQLIALARKGNHEAYGALVRRHQTSAFNVARRVVGDAQDALDVTQDAFVRAYDALASFDLTRPFAPWLHTITTNLALNHVQRKRPTQELPLELEAPDPHSNPERRALEGEQQQRVRKALLQLPPAWRAVVELRHFQDLSYEEIARALNLPVSDVKSHLFRARTKLKDLFEQSE